MPSQIVKVLSCWGCSIQNGYSPKHQATTRMAVRMKISPISCWMIVSVVIKREADVTQVSSQLMQDWMNVVARPRGHSWLKHSFWRHFLFLLYVRSLYFLLCFIASCTSHWFALLSVLRLHGFKSCWLLNVKKHLIDYYLPGALNALFYCSWHIVRDCSQDTTCLKYRHVSCVTWVSSSSQQMTQTVYSGLGQTSPERNNCQVLHTFAGMMTRCKLCHCCKFRYQNTALTESSKGLVRTSPNLPKARCSSFAHVHWTICSISEFACSFQLHGYSLFYQFLTYQQHS